MVGQSVGRVEYADKGEGQEHTGEGRRRDFAVESDCGADKRNDAINQMEDDMILNDVKDARNTIQWVQDHLANWEDEDVYIKGLDRVDKLLNEIQRLLEEVH